MKISKFINFFDKHVSKLPRYYHIWNHMLVILCPFLHYLAWNIVAYICYKLMWHKCCIVNPKNVTSQRDNHAFGDLGLNIIVSISLSHHMQYNSNLLPKEPLLALTCHVVFNQYAMYICINQMSKFFQFKHCRPIWSL
jgi:hypothetical protein